MEEPVTGEPASASGWTWSCPLTHRPLRSMSLAEVEADFGDAPLRPVDRLGSTAAPIGRTETVLWEPSGKVAYPVLDGIPVLLSPERLHARAEQPPVDLRHANYAEAYAEMDFYNSAPVADDELRRIVEAIRSTSSPEATFPEAADTWIDATYDGPAQLDCYRQLAPATGRTLLQLGGGGLHAVKFLLAGAERAVVITPMIGEARRARWLAESVGVQDRLEVALGIAEELPLPDACLDGIFSGGCAHHMQMATAMPEVQRVLRPGAAFTAAEPWRAPLYAAGTRILGKREANAHCRPFTADRLQPLLTTFPNAAVTHHGALTRYALLALSKAGHRTNAATLLPVFAKDDALADRLRLRRHGSSVSIVAVRQ